jgi:cobyrinic acid a,c-diamide synthase
VTGKKGVMGELQQGPTARAIVVAGSASHVGKSSLSIGLMAALCERDMAVQSFKVGPDLVDPLYHGRATGRPSVNLDRWFSRPGSLRNAWAKYSEGVDFCIIEGTMGLLDDLGCPDIDDGGCKADLLPYNTAKLAKWLGVPVVLVMDGSRLENSIGALVRGYHTWDPRVEICGIIFNNVRDLEDLAGLEAIVHSACPHKIPILGGVPNDEMFQSSDLESAFDASVINKKIISLCSLVAHNVDIDRILQLARPASQVLGPSPPNSSIPRSGDMAAENTQLSKSARRRARRKQRRESELLCGMTEPSTLNAHSEASSDVASCSTGTSAEACRVTCRIAIARDSAFNFYYEENLELMRDLGLDLVYFSPLTEALPSNISAVYLGGGVPELHAAALADNRVFRAGMKKFAEAGGVVFAEGGGLLVLCQSLQTRTGFPQQPMVGVFPFRAIMSKAKWLKGYVEMTVGDDCPIFPPKSIIKGYMNSNSELVQEHHVGGITTAREWRGTYRARLFESYYSKEFLDVVDGYATSNVLGSYVHHHFGDSPEVLQHFVQKCRRVNVGAVTNAVSGARRMAEYLEGSVAYTPPLTPRRANLGIVGVHSSPELHCERRSRSRPQSLDLNGISYDLSVLPNMGERRYQIPKTQSSGSLGHRTTIEGTVYDHRMSSGAASPIKEGCLTELHGMGHNKALVRAMDCEQRHTFPRASQERFQYRLSNNSECPSVMSSDGSELAERSSSGLIALNLQNKETFGGYYSRLVGANFDLETPGPYGDHSRNISIAVCNAGVRDIIQAFDIQSLRLIDVSRNGLGAPILAEKAIGSLQSKSVQALQHFHSRRNSSDAGSELSLGENVETVVKSVFGRQSLGTGDIDFDAIAQVKPNVMVMETPADQTGNTQASSVERVRRISPKTKVVTLDPCSLADVLESILTIGEAICERDQAVAIVNKLRERLRKVVSYSQKAKLTMSMSQRPRIAILGSLHPLTVEGRWINDLINLVGGEPLPLAGQRKRSISWEDLTKFAPNVLVVCAPIMNSGDKSAKVFNDLCDIASQPGWWQLPAVKDGVVVICEEALISRMGLRLIDGAEALARVVYGDHVPTCCLPRSAFKLKLSRPGQRVRPRLLPNYFMAYA